MAAYISDIVQNEEARLNALRDLHLLDTSPSESFDRLTRLASHLLNAPVSTISLTDRDRQWFKSKVGVDITEIPREQAPCSYAIENNDVFVVPDMLEDGRFATSPLAQSGIRFYAGAPLFTRQGHGLGTICVVDDTPRNIDEDERQVLRDLAGMVMTQVDLQNTIGRVDAATGLPNQNQMLEELDELALTHAGSAAVGIMFELLHRGDFGHVERILGFDFSEQMVRGIVGRLQSLHNSARLYHVGPTRCVFVLTPDFLGETDSFVADLVADLSRPVECSGIPITPDPLVGILEFEVGAVKPRDVLRCLYNAVDDAVESPTNVARYSPARDIRSVRRFTLLNDFKAALDGDQLSLVYQPLLDMRSGDCHTVEALVRWNHPTLGPISPGEFVPAVEQTALVRPLTEWVARTALRQIEDWRRQGLDLTVSINVSALNLDETDFTERLTDLIVRSGIAPKNLKLEFTESAVAKDGDRVNNQLATLKAGGIDIAIDDFGTGYCNLSYLQKLPATILKIDRAFVTDLETEPRNQALVRTIIEMAHLLDYRVVAEGIETQEAFELLKNWGCDEGQGYLMAKPMSARDLTMWMGKAERLRKAS